MTESRELQVSNNLALWNAVETSNPDDTKKVSRSAHGPYTTVDAQSQLKKATEMWGPYGDRWGLRDLEYRSVTLGDTPMLILNAIFFYPTKCDDGRPEEASFEIWNDMPLKVGDWCYKKLQTNTRSKCLSMLGFNADIYMGMFEDEVYLSQVSAAASESKLIKQIETFIGKAGTCKAVDSATIRAENLMGEGKLSFEAFESIMQQAAERVRELGRSGGHQQVMDATLRRIGCETDEQRKAVTLMLTGTEDPDPQLFMERANSAGEEFGWENILAIALEASNED